MRRPVSGSVTDFIESSSVMLALLHRHAHESGLHQFSLWQFSRGLGILAEEHSRWPHEKEVDASPKEIELMRRAAHFCTLATAAYGPFGALLVGWSRGNFFATAWHLLRGLWRPNEAAFEVHTRQTARKHLLYAQWRPRGVQHQGCYSPAHFITIDHAERAIVFVVRGSLGLCDLITDLSDVPTDSDVRRLGEGCHGGIADAAQLLVERHESLLRHAMRAYPSYQLVLTGHSLGAGIASFAAILLDERLTGRRAWWRRAAWWRRGGPQVHAYAFAPPCTLPMRASRRHDHLIDAFVCNYDLVPHISAGSLRHLCEAVAIANGDDDLRGSIDSSSGEGHLSLRAVRTSDGTDNAAADPLLALWRRRKRCPDSMTRYPPGRLLRLRSPVAPHSTEKHARSTIDHPHGEAWCVTRLDRRALGQIRIHKGMLRDHGFDRYGIALQQAGTPQGKPPAGAREAADEVD
jgi:hypothetical protein